MRKSCRPIGVFKWSIDASLRQIFGKIQQFRLEFAYMSKIFILSLILSLQAFGADKNALINNVFEAMTKIKPSKEKEQKEENREPKVTYKSDDIDDCEFKRLLRVSAQDYSKLSNKDCAGVIELLRNYNSYKDGDIIYIEFVPIKCTETNTKGRLYNCK